MGGWRGGESWVRADVDLGGCAGKAAEEGVGAEAHGGHDAGTPLGMHECGGGVSVDGREDSGSRGAQQAKTDGC